ENREERVPLEAVRLLLPDGAMRSRPLGEVLERALQVTDAANFARTLVNEPAGRLTPEALAEEASRAAKGRGLEVRVSGPSELKKLRMGMFSAVGQGSQNTPRLIEISYRPKKAAAARARPVSLVGKAITFDSGGLSLKSAENMADMKSDMAGSAAVLGALQVAAELALPFPVLGYLGAAENMPSGAAYRPGDILVSRLGKTVEVTNTDAEGRLVLGDVLAYAVEEKPSAIVDLATLTGACVVALGHWVAGLFSNSDGLADELLSASARAGEAFWRLPLVDLQKETLRSDVADIKNHGDRWGGAISAAVFLREFVGDTPWAHLDIAGPALAPRERGYQGKGATGIGVRTLAAFLEGRAPDGRQAATGSQDAIDSARAVRAATRGGGAAGDRSGGRRCRLRAEGFAGNVAVALAQPPPASPRRPDEPLPRGGPSEANTVDAGEGADQGVEPVDI